MKKNERIKHLGYCRRCLNDVYGLNLKKRDVLIYQFPGVCRNCKNTRNIVAQVKLHKQWKLLCTKGL